MEHRRADRRYDRRLAVELTSEGRSFAGHTRNLSLGGLFVETDQTLPFAARVVVKFHVPTLPEAIEAEAHVRWIESADAAGRGGIGVRFTGLRAREVWALNKFFDRPA